MKRKIMLIVNGMFYGDSYTKRCFWGIFTIAILCIAVFIIGLAFGIWPFYLVALALFAADAFFIHSISLDVGMTQNEEEENEEDKDVEEKPDKKPKGKKKENNTEPEDILKAEKDNDKIVETSLEADSKEKEKESDLGEVRQNMTEKDMKQLMHRYKVKKNHRPVLIDSCIKYHIHECPAYIWTHRGQFHILLLEKEPRKLTLPISAVTKMTYEKGVAANQRKEYDCLVGKSLISLVFNEYKPTYYGTIRDGRQMEAKNLYVIGPGIKVTNTSAKELITVLQPEFMVEDEITQSEDYNQYFKQIYKQNILLKDGVLSMKEYQNRIRPILQRFAEAPVTPAAFRMTLGQMVQMQLISNEYSTYYMQQNRQYRERNKS